MGNIAQFRNKIFICAIIIAVIAQLISLFILGLDLEFTVGLIVGTVVAIVNFFVMVICLEITLEKKKVLINTLGFLIRFALYGISFAFTVMHSYKMGAGCAIGFFTIQLSILYLFAIKPSLKRTKEI